MAVFCCHHKHEYIQKAKSKKRPKWSKTRTPKRLEALAVRMSGAIAVDLKTGINVFRRKISPEKVYQAWLSRKYEGIRDHLPWDDLPDHLEKTAKTMGSGLDKFTELGIDAIPPSKQPLLRYDSKNPAIQRIQQERSGDLITRITNETRSTVAEIVKNNFDRGWSPQDIAQEVRNYVGLTPRYAQAHANYINGLKEKGMDPDKVDALGDRYYQRLLDSRAKTIARTETQFMLNRGQLEVWKEASRQGLISKNAMKVWVADGDPCPICEDMDGEAVPIHESWVLPEGDEVDIPTETHPNCNCIMTLETDDDEDEEETEE